jgi:hypothetical protein
MTQEQRKGIFWGALAAVLLGAAIFVGSRNLRHIDAALVGYTFASLFAAFGLGYRYSMWLQRPPTRLYWRRGWRVFFRPRQLARNCILAAAITFPLAFGWVYFETVPGDLSRYQVFVFGLPTLSFPHESLIGHLVFHGLVWSSFLVIACVLLALHRRLHDHGAAALQDLQEDILPLFMLFAVSVTGLLLTVSYTWLKGYAYEVLAISHAVTVIFTLLWLPFGKFSTSSRGRDALHLADRIHRLPPPVPAAGAGRPDAAVLDQHGRDGHLHAGRRAAGGRGGPDAPLDRAAAVPQRDDAAVLGHGDVVDPDLAGAGGVAAPRQAGAAYLRTRQLGRGVPARDVHRVYPEPDPRLPAPVPGSAAGGLRLDRRGRLDVDRGGPNSATGAIPVLAGGLSRRLIGCAFAPGSEAAPGRLARLGVGGKGRLRLGRHVSGLDQLLTVDGDVARGFDPDADFATIDIGDRDLDVAVDEDRFADFAGKDEHVGSSMRVLGVRPNSCIFQAEMPTTIIFRKIGSLGRLQRR